MLMIVMWLKKSLIVAMVAVWALVPCRLSTRMHRRQIRR